MPWPPRGSTSSTAPAPAPLDPRPVAGGIIGRVASAAAGASPAAALTRAGRATDRPRSLPSFPRGPGRWPGPASGAGRVTSVRPPRRPTARLARATADRRPRHHARSGSTRAWPSARALGRVASAAEGSSPAATLTRAGRATDRPRSLPSFPRGSGPWPGPASGAGRVNQVRPPRRPTARPARAADDRRTETSFTHVVGASCHAAPDVNGFAVPLRARRRAPVTSGPARMARRPHLKVCSLNLGLLDKTGTSVTRRPQRASPQICSLLVISR